MRGRNKKIVNVESVSVGKRPGENNDGIYIGEDFAIAIDGVSNNSAIEVNGKHIEIADIITEAIRQNDGNGFFRALNFEEFVKYINTYISKYCKEVGYPLDEKPLEATAAIYSRYYNQIWLVGDARAICDGEVIQNELKIDEVFTKIRIELTKALLKEGYSQEELMDGSSLERKIIDDPKLIKKHIKDKERAEEIEEYLRNLMHETLQECGFSEEEIVKKNLLEKYNNPRKLQMYLKNNPNVGEYGYSVFNGKDTEIKNCKVVYLPPNVKTIKLFSDGIFVDVMEKSKDLGAVVRNLRKNAKKDPLSIGENETLKSAFHQSKRFPYLAIDDSSAVVIRIEQEQYNIKNNSERDDGR